MPEAAKKASCLVQPILKDFLLVIPVPQEGICKIITMALNNLNLFSEVLAEICSHVPLNTLPLAVKPIGTANVMDTFHWKTTTEQSIGAPVNVSRLEDGGKPRRQLPVQDKSPVWEVNSLH